MRSLIRCFCLFAISLLIVACPSNPVKPPGEPTGAFVIKNYWPEMERSQKINLESNGGQGIEYNFESCTDLTKNGLEDKNLVFYRDLGSLAQKLSVTQTSSNQTVNCLANQDKGDCYLKLVSHRSGGTEVIGDDSSLFCIEVTHKLQIIFLHLYKAK